MAYLILVLSISNTYPTEIQLNKSKFFDTEALLLGFIKTLGYNIDIMRQSALPGYKPKRSSYRYGVRFNCMVVGQASDSTTTL